MTEVGDWARVQNFHFVQDRSFFSSNLSNEAPQILLLLLKINMHFLSPPLPEKLVRLACVRCHPFPPTL